MEEVKYIKIRSRLDELSRIESFVESFCLKYRIYDEYFGIILHSLSEIARKIIKHNTKEGDIRIEQNHQKNKVEYRFTSDEGLDMNLIFNDKNPTDIALEKLIDQIEIVENSITITYNIRSIHYNEWIRRKNLLFEYQNKSKKRAK